MTAHTPFHWTTEPPIDDSTQYFPDQASAEAWLSESWSKLADRGVTSVTLHEGDHLVYGPMSLSAE